MGKTTIAKNSFFWFLKNKFNWSQGPESPLLIISESVCPWKDHYPLRNGHDQPPRIKLQSKTDQIKPIPEILNRAFMVKNKKSLWRTSACFRSMGNYRISNSRTILWTMEKKKQMISPWTVTLPKKYSIMSPIQKLSRPKGSDSEIQ